MILVIWSQKQCRWKCYHIKTVISQQKKRVFTINSWRNGFSKSRRLVEPRAQTWEIEMDRVSNNGGVGCTSCLSGGGITTAVIWQILTHGSHPCRRPKIDLIVSVTLFQPTVLGRTESYSVDFVTFRGRRFAEVVALRGQLFGYSCLWR